MRLGAVGTVWDTLLNFGTGNDPFLKLFGVRVSLKSIKRKTYTKLEVTRKTCSFHNVAWTFMLYIFKLLN